MTTTIFREVSPLSFKRGSLHPFIGVTSLVSLGDTSKVTSFLRRECVALSLSIRQVVTLRLPGQVAPSVTAAPKAVAKPFHAGRARIFAIASRCPISVIRFKTRCALPCKRMRTRGLFLVPRWPVAGIVEKMNPAWLPIEGET